MAEAMDFLRRHQPLPADGDLERKDLEVLDCVRRLLMKNPQVEALDLLLGVFGEGNGFGVYQLIGDTVAAHDRADVVQVLCKKLATGPRSVRYWCAQIASGYADDKLVAPLAVNLDPNDEDLRYATITALENIATPQAKEALRRWLPQENVEELREVIQEALDE